MAVEAPIPERTENAAIDMTIQMVVESLAQALQKPVEEVLAQFLQSKTCALLYDRATKLWWDGPLAVEALYLEELRDA